MAIQFRPHTPIQQRLTHPQRVVANSFVAMLLAWLFSFVVTTPVSAQSAITDGTPCFASRNLTNLSTGANRGITNQPVISGNGARVAFWSVNNLSGNNVDGNIEIFVGETGSSSVVQLTDSVGSILGGFNLEPSINAAGTRIAFYSDRDLVAGQNADGNFEIFLARRANNGTWSIAQVTNTTGSANLFPSINSDGTRIAFVSDDAELHNVDQSRANSDRNFEIFLVTLPNSGAAQFRQITNTGAGITNDQPVINATGNRVAFTAASGQTSQVFVWDESRGAPAQLTQTDNNDQPSISADGTNIAYIATAANDRSRVVLHTLSADGSESRAEVIVPSASNTKYRSPSISGNGERVVYVEEQASGSAIQINVMLYDVNTSLFVPISEVGGGTGEQPAISSDGTRVTFVGVQALAGSTEDTGSDIYLNECPQADLSLEFRSPPPETVLAGIDVVYQLRVTNHGPSVAEDAFFRSDLSELPGLPANVDYLLPAGCTINANDLLVCPLGDIAVNASVDFTFGYDVPSNAGLADLVSELEVGANIVDSNPDDNSTGRFTTRVFEEAALSLQVTADRTSILAGSVEELTYDLIVTNGGPSQARSARITDTLPVGSVLVSYAIVQGGGAGASCPTPVNNVVVCSLGNLTAGSVTTVRIVVKAAASASQDFSNVATVRSLTAESNLANNTVVTVTKVELSSDMAITKRATPAASVIAGREITYTLTYTNLGFADTRDVTVIDSLPMGVTYARSVLPSGASCTPSGGGQIVTCTFPGALPVNSSRTFSIVVLVGSTVPAGTIVNSARVRSGLSDPNPANDDSPPVATTVTILSDLVLSKTANELTPDIGETFTYTIKLRNNGPSQAYGVAVSDVLSTGLNFLGASASMGSYDQNSGVWTVGTLPVAPVGQEQTLTIRVSAKDETGGVPIVNTATASGSQPEPTPELPSTDSVTVIPQRADLQVSKQSTPGPAAHVIAGKPLTYTLTITNAGPTTATAVMLTDVLPENVFLVSVNEPGGRAQCAEGGTVTCVVGNVANGAVLNYTIVVTRSLKGVITNTVSVSSVTPDLDLNNNNASHTIKVDPDLPKHLQFVQPPPISVRAGEVFTPAPVIRILDQFNNLIDETEGSTDTIRFTAFSGAGCANLLADQSSLNNGEVAAVGGIATFSNLYYTRSETISLEAVIVGRTVDALCSQQIGINPDSVKQLHFITPPLTMVAGDLKLEQAITISRTDQFGNDVTESDFTATLQHNSSGTFVDHPSTANPINSIIIPSGSVTATFFYTNVIAGNYTITATEPGVIPAVQPLTVVAAPAQELLVVISAPLTATAGVSSDPFTVQRVDRFNNPNSSDNAVTVNLRTDPLSPTGLFRNVTDTATITQVVIPLGSSTAQFRYQDILAATHVISITDANPNPSFALKGDAVSIDVVPNVTYRLVITSPPQSIVAGTLSDEIRVVRQDVYGNHNFADPALPVNLSSSSTGSGVPEFYDTSLTPTSMVEIPNGSDHVEFVYSDELALPFTLTAAAGGKVSGTYVITVTPDVPVNLAIITTTTVITAGAPPFGVTIQRQDRFANPAPSITPLDIFLSTTSPRGRFFEQASNNPIAQVTITGTDASFRYQDLEQGEWTLAYSDNLSSNFDASQQISVTSAPPAKLVYTQKPITVTAGVKSGAFVVERRDLFDNAYKGPEPLTVYMTSTSPGNFKFFDDINAVTTVSSLEIPGGASSTTFYYSDDRAGSHLITTDDLGALSPATTTLTVQAAAANKTVFINASIVTTAGVLSPPLTVQVQDFFGNPVTPSVDSPVVIPLTTTATLTGKFYDPVNSALQISQLSIGGVSSNSFLYYDTRSGGPSITANDIGSLLPDVEIVTVVPAQTSKIVFFTQPLTLTAGVTSTTAIVVQRRDQYDNVNLNDPSRVVTLSSNSTGVARFVHPSDPTVLPANQITITTGTGQATFRYYDTKRGTPTITATSAGLLVITQTHTVLGADATRLKLGGSSNWIAGVAQPITITAFDAFGNIADPYTGPKLLTFGGAGNAPDGDVPTVTNSAASPLNFGSETEITFSTGVASAGGSMTLYDAGQNVVITAQQGSISATGSDAITVTVAPNTLQRVQAETTSGGAEVGVIVPTQEVAPNAPVQLWAVGRDTFGNSMGNVITTTWHLTATGGVSATTDLVTNGAQATFTGHLAGTAVLEPRVSGGVLSVPSGTITVTPGLAATVRPETKEDGSGVLITAQQIMAGNVITAYAVSRDANGNFTGLRVSNWTMVETSGNINADGNLVPSGSSTFTVFTAKRTGSGKLQATPTSGSLTVINSGTIEVIAGSATNFLVTMANTNLVAGTPGTLQITARDAYNNTATGYTGNKGLIFSGPQPSTRPVTHPVVNNFVSTPISMGQVTTLTFASGVFQQTGNSGNMTLYQAVPSVAVNVSDGPIVGSINVAVTSRAANDPANKFAIDAASSTIMAGEAVPLTLTFEDMYGNRIITYDTNPQLYFNSNTNAGQPGFPATVTNDNGDAIALGNNNNRIDFEDGLAQVSGNANGVMRLYKVGTYEINVKQNNGDYPSGVHGSKTFTVTPSTSQQLALNLAATQENRTAFVGTNVITLTDVYANPVPPRPVTITTDLPGTIIIAGSGDDNVLETELGATGSANLSADGLAMRYEGPANTSGIFTAITANPLGGNLTSQKSVIMRHAPPALVRITGATPSQIENNMLLVGAGQPISLTLRLFDVDNNPTDTYNNAGLAFDFTLTPAPTTAATVSNNSGTALATNAGNDTAIAFVSGVSSVASNGNNGRLILYEAGTYTLTAVSSTPGITTQDGHALVINVLPGPPQSVELELDAATQTNDATFTGTNELRVRDAHGNLATNFGPGEYVTLTVTSPVTGVVALPLSNGGTPVLTGADLAGSGVADLTALGLKYTGLEGNVQLRATLRRADGSTTVADDSVTVVHGALDHFILSIAETAEPAGTPLASTLTAKDVSGNVVVDAPGQLVTFRGGLSAPDGTAAQVNQGTDVDFDTALSLNFTSGVANFDVKFYKADTHTVYVEQESAQVSNNVAVVVLPGDHATFGVNIGASQTLSQTFAAPAEISALDSYENVITGYEADTTANVVASVIVVNNGSCTLTPAIAGLSGGTALTTANDFTDGVASLIANGNAMTLNSACPGTYKFRFERQDNNTIFGESAEISFVDP